MNDVFRKFKEALYSRLSKLYADDPENDLYIIEPADKSEELEFGVYLRDKNGLTPELADIKFGGRFVLCKPSPENDHWLLMFYVQASPGNLVSSPDKAVLVTDVECDFENIVYNYLTFGTMAELGKLQ